MDSNKFLDSDTTKNSTPTNAQKRKATTTILSLYDSDEETKVSSGKKISTNSEGVDDKHTSLNAGSAKSNSTVKSVCIERKGEREEMQDRHLIIDTFERHFGTLLLRSDSQGVREQRRCALYALFDGHAGKRAADFCAENFARTFVTTCKKHIPSNSAVIIFEKSMKKIFIDTYKTLDDEFLAEARKHKPTLKDGTTATTIFLLENSLYCANIGDSKAVVCRHKPDENRYIPLQLTVDHNPIVFDERMRIQKAGGLVKDGRVMGILEVSRSIGDGQMKAHGVISIPDIKKLTITANDHFLILACDGLWKIFSPESAVKFVVDQYKMLGKKPEYIEDQKIAELWTKIVDELSAEAVRKGCGDNVSVLIAILSDSAKLNDAFSV